MPDGSGRNSPAGDRLRGFVERIERLEEEKAAIAADIRDVKSEAKGAGFDVKIINQMLRERRMEQNERQEYLALCELYRASLGMLDGTPLGEAARRRLMPPPPPGDVKGGDADGGDKPAAAAAPEPEPPPAVPPETLDEARAKGHAAARGGAKIFDNPYVAGDPRRAAWDEGWCAETGSDGMELPAAWRRKKPEKPEKAKPEKPDQSKGSDKGDGSAPPDGPSPDAPDPDASGPDAPDPAAPGDGTPGDDTPADPDEKGEP